MRTRYSGMEELSKALKISFGENSQEREDQVWMKSPKNQPFKGPQEKHIRKGVQAEICPPKVCKFMRVGHVSNCWLIDWLVLHNDWLVNQSLLREKNCWLLRSYASGCAKASTEPRRGPPIIIWLVTISSLFTHLYNALLIRLVECSVYLKTDSFAKIWFFAADEFKLAYVPCICFFVARCQSKF